MTTADFILDLARRARYRRLAPHQISAEAAERLVSDSAPAVLALAILDEPESEASEALAAAIDELDIADPDATIRRLETTTICREILDGQVPALAGGAQLAALSYEDEDDQLLLAAWRAMADSDDSDQRASIEAEITQLVTDHMRRGSLADDV